MSDDAMKAAMPLPATQDGQPIEVRQKAGCHNQARANRAKLLLRAQMGEYKRKRQMFRKFHGFPRTTFRTTDFAACSVFLPSRRARTTKGCSVAATQGSA